MNEKGSESRLVVVALVVSVTPSRPNAARVVETERI